MDSELNINQEKTYDKQEINLIDAYIGKNTDKLKDGSFSWCTLIFGLTYVFYRKMWLLGFLWLLIDIVLVIILSILTIKFPFVLALIKIGDYSISSVIVFISSLIINITIAFLFKKLYLKKVTKKVEEIKQKNIEKTNEELVKICSKKGGTTILGIILSFVLLVVIPVLVGTLMNMKTLDNVNKSAAEDNAYSIISSVENAHSLAILNSKDANITLGDIKKEYDGKFSVWNDDNTITPKQTNYDFVCNVKVNEKNEMQVSCDVYGKIIESELLSLGNSKDNSSDETSKPTDTISYRIEEKKEGQLTIKYLYVNDKLVDFMNDSSSIKVKQLSDILIVERTLSSKELFAVDKNANVIGVFANKHNENDKNFELLQTKLYYRDTYRIDGNDIYVQTDQLGNGGIDNTLCNQIIDDNEIVVYEEKFTYLGNNKFSKPTVTKQVIRKEYMQDHNVTCDTKELLKEKDLLINKTSNRINFYKNKKLISSYSCGGANCWICHDIPSAFGAFARSNSEIYENGQVTLYDGPLGDTSVIIFDIYNNEIIKKYDNLVDSYELGNKYIVVKNKDNQFAILDNNYEYVKKYSNKQFLYRSDYVGNNNFNVEKDMIISIENGKYGIEKISKNEMIINHKYDNIALTDGITVYSSDGTKQNFFYTDTLYQNKYFKAKTGDKWYLYYLDTDKKVIDKGYDRLYLIDKNTLAVYEDGKISFIDYKGNYITDEKIEVAILDEGFYKSPEGIKFLIKDNTVSIHVNNKDGLLLHLYDYNLQTKKITKVN